MAKIEQIEWFVAADVKPPRETESVQGWNQYGWIRECHYDHITKVWMVWDTEEGFGGGWRFTHYPPTHWAYQPKGPHECS